MHLNALYQYNFVFECSIIDSTVNIVLHDYVFRTADIVVLIVHHNN